VFIYERFYQKIIINTANLWALVLCLAVFLLKSLLPLMPILISLRSTGRYHYWYFFGKVAILAIVQKV